MTYRSVNEFTPLIQQEIDSLLIQKENLFAIEHLANVALGNTFLDLPKITIHSHLCVLHDFLEKVITINEFSLDLLQGEIRKMV